MPGVDDLGQLIREMRPVMKERDLVFCSLGYRQLLELPIDPILSFKEDEGITLVVHSDVADRLGLEYTGVWSRIVLTVHSDLEAIGFLAKITETLADEGISCNVVSAFYHDHLFVPADRAKDALNALKKLSHLYRDA